MPFVIGRSQRWRVRAGHALLWAAIGLTIYPFVRTILLSLSRGNYYDSGTLLPELSFDHWKLILGLAGSGDSGLHHGGVLGWFWNSLRVAATATLLASLFALTTAYAFARFRFRLRPHFDQGLYLAQMFPVMLLGVAYFRLFDALGGSMPSLGIDSLGALTLAYTGSAVCGMVWAFKGYFHTLPREIEEAARVEGASEWQVFRHIALPLVRPMIIVMMLTTGLSLMYEMPIASILIMSGDTATIPIGIMTFSAEVGGGGSVSAAGDEAAAVILLSLPGTIGFLVAQRWIVSTIEGGVKH